MPDDLRRTRHSGPEPTEPWGLAESWIEDPDGIRVVLVEFPLATLSAVTYDRRHRPGVDGLPLRLSVGVGPGGPVRGTGVRSRPP